MRRSWMVCGVGLSLALGLLAVSARAADWPQWRGPARDGISQEHGLQADWDAAPPKLLWQLDGVGGGLRQRLGRRRETVHNREHRQGTVADLRRPREARDRLVDAADRRLAEAWL